MEYYYSPPYLTQLVFGSRLGERLPTPGLELRSNRDLKMHHRSKTLGEY